LKSIKDRGKMKKYVFLILSLILVRNSLSQSTDIFDEGYFVNTISELLDNNIDSIKLYSGIDSINIHPEPIKSDYYVGKSIFYPWVVCQNYSNLSGATFETS